MILKIYSNNDHLADLLHKNPQTDEGLYAKPLKSGIVIGNVVSAHRYEVLFQDMSNGFTEETGNQLDFQSLCNPLAVLNSCTELFGHVLKEKNEYEAQEMKWLNGLTRGQADTQPCTIQVPVFYINSSWYRNGVFLLERYFKGIDVKRMVGNNYYLTITASTLFEAMNLLNLTALFTHLTNVDAFNTFIDDSFAQKYLRVLTNLEQVPYFVLYLFIKRAVKNNAQFTLVKPVLEAYLAQYGIAANLTSEDTQRSRLGFITSEIGIDHAVLDIGCGEFAYYKQLTNKGFAHSYYAVDRDENLRRLGENIMNRMNTDNLSFYTRIDEVLPKERINIIMSEVIEHNAPEVSAALVKRALLFDFGKLVISTPNAAFNKFYFENGFRHEDHHFEFTGEEFRLFIEACTENRADIQVTYMQVGDELNGICPTQLAIIKKKIQDEKQR
ncbi:class I SAM-dependent methyltransferase [Niabella pedocola]|uniref:Small RNA 2'-O-methyltransferase n=1 Tax=Niabella pedocola TaxID=1752077 RepID=A0ABS8PLH7_9BACT|nr:class I SAM-dependent methyltransferase [Niabella pedocola]MCD2421720.1 class I SAM-dependent methyltransferase [Niabella pedocola]